MDKHCQFTIYAPDPQDCGDPAIVTIEEYPNPLPLCEKHWAFHVWAMTQTDSEEVED